MIKNITTNKVLLFLFIFSSFFLNLNFIVADAMSNEKYNFIIVFLIILNFCLPSIYYYFNHSHYKNIPLIEITLLFFLISYLAIFFFGLDRTVKAFAWYLNGLSNEEYQIFIKIFKDPLEYLKIIYYSLTSFLVGYFFIFLFFKNKNNYLVTKIKFNSIIHSKHYFIFGTIGFLFTIILFIFPELLRLNIINQFKETIFLFSVLCFSIIIFNKKNIFFLKIISLIILFILFFVNITETGSQIGTTLMFILLVLNYWFLEKRIFFIGIFFILFNFYYFQDIKVEYRSRLHEISTELRSPIIKIKNYLQSFDLVPDELKLRYSKIKEKLKEKDSKNVSDINQDKDLEEELIKIENRIQALNETKKNVSSARMIISSVALNKILDKYSKNEIKLKDGETYKTLPFFFIPRFFWKNKPTSSFGIEYGLATNLTMVETPTSINLSWISESFWNFGNYFFIPMFVKGIILSLLSFFFVYRRQCFIFYSWLTVISPIFIPESNFAIMLGPVFLKFLFLIIVISIYKFCFINDEKNKYFS